MRIVLTSIILNLFLVNMQICAATTKPDFSLHKLGPKQPGPTILVIGGIQGDEPGGFTAASLLVTNYSISKGNVWVVPNLNFASIIKRSRGVYGDMNRKFSTIRKSDPEYQAVSKIKSIILNDEVDLVLNLHDGSGFYRKAYIDKWHNQYRWGQSIIIDQEKISAPKYGGLGTISNAVVEIINSKIQNKERHFLVKNTYTADGNVEMEKTLTYFAIKHGKPAFGVEASKHFLTHERAYYHLTVLEAYMELLGIQYEKDFDLTLTAVKNNIGRDVKLSLYDRKIYLDVANVRRRLRYVPLKKNAPLNFASNNPLVAITDTNKNYKVSYGNRYLTSLHPQYFDYDSSLESVKMDVDGSVKWVSIGDAINVNKEFLVQPIEGYRVNVIGFTRPGVSNETGLKIRRKDIMGRFSVDRDGRLFRVEFYQGDKFSGMVLVKFVSQPVALETSTAEDRSNI